MPNHPQGAALVIYFAIKLVGFVFPNAVFVICGVAGFRGSNFFKTVAVTAVIGMIGYMCARYQQMINFYESDRAGFPKIVLWQLFGWSLFSSVFYGLGLGVSKLF